MQNQKLCPNCKKLVKDEKVCPHCGFVLDEKVVKLDTTAEVLTPNISKDSIDAASMVDPLILNTKVIDSSVENAIDDDVKEVKVETKEEVIAKTEQKLTKESDKEKDKKKEDVLVEVTGAVVATEIAKSAKEAQDNVKEQENKKDSKPKEENEEFDEQNIDLSTPIKNKADNKENLKNEKQETPQKDESKKEELTKKGEKENTKEEKEEKKQDEKDKKKKSKDKDKSKSKDKDKDKEEILDTQSEEEKPKIMTIFEDLIPDDFQPTQEAKQKTATVTKKVVPVILALILFFIAAFAYYKFYYETPDYIIPLVLSTEDQQAIDQQKVADGPVIPTAILASREKILDFQIPLQEGNFEKGNLLIFSPENINMSVQLFNIKDLFNTYVKSDLLENLQKDYNITDDDLSVYLSNGYALLFPKDNLKTWGYVTEIKDLDFVKERVDKFNKDRENENFKYKGYYAEIIEISKNKAKGLSDIDFEKLEKELEEEKDEAEVKKEETQTKDENKKEDTDKKQAEEKNAEKEDKENKSDSRYYLLFSNSKEFLDEMKESTEGNLPNLTDNIFYVDAKNELPVIGQVLVFKQSKDTWKSFIEYITPQIDYVGLNRILESIDSHGVVAMPKNDKTKLIQSEE